VNDICGGEEWFGTKEDDSKNAWTSSFFFHLNVEFVNYSFIFYSFSSVPSDSVLFGITEFTDGISIISLFRNNQSLGHFIE
jgi:hypothetical protein